MDKADRYVFLSCFVLQTAGANDLLKLSFLIELVMTAHHLEKIKRLQIAPVLWVVQHFFFPAGFMKILKDCASDIQVTFSEDYALRSITLAPSLMASALFLLPSFRYADEIWEGKE